MRIISGNGSGCMEETAKCFVSIAVKKSRRNHTKKAEYKGFVLLNAITNQQEKEKKGSLNMLHATIVGKHSRKQETDRICFAQIFAQVNGTEYKGQKTN